MKKIYIILSQTGTLFSKAIKWHTKDPYNHASISFDQNLEAMYSFGRKRRYNPIDTGLIQENFDKGIFPYFPNARCCILEIPVAEEEYKVMYKIVEEFLIMEKEPDTKFGLRPMSIYYERDLLKSEISKNLSAHIKSLSSLANDKTISMFLPSLIQFWKLIFMF